MDRVGVVLLVGHGGPSGGAGEGRRLPSFGWWPQRHRGKRCGTPLATGRWLSATQVSEHVPGRGVWIPVPQGSLARGQGIAIGTGLAVG